MMFQNVLNSIINLHGIDVTIKSLESNVIYDLRAVISNYFRAPVVEEEIQSIGRQYIISAKDLTFTPKRGDRFTISASQYFSISDVQEMVAFGQTIGYRLVLKWLLLIFLTKDAI